MSQNSLNKKPKPLLITTQIYQKEVSIAVLNTWSTFCDPTFDIIVYANAVSLKERFLS